MNKPTSAYNTGLIIKALAFAAHKHRYQHRKGVNPSPYINHPIALADVLCNEGGISEVAMAKVLLQTTLTEVN